MQGGHLGALTKEDKLLKRNSQKHLGFGVALCPHLPVGAMGLQMYISLSRYW